MSVDELCNAQLGQHLGAIAMEVVRLQRRANLVSHRVLEEQVFGGLGAERYIDTGPRRASRGIHPPFLGGVDTRKGSQQRRLPRSVATHQSDYLATFEREGYRVDHHAAVV